MELQLSHRHIYLPRCKMTHSGIKLDFFRTKSGTMFLCVKTFAAKLQSIHWAIYPRTNGCWTTPPSTWNFVSKMQNNPFRHKTRLFFGQSLVQCFFVWKLSAAKLQSIHWPIYPRTNGCWTRPPYMEILFITWSTLGMAAVQQSLWTPWGNMSHTVYVLQWL